MKQKKIGWIIYAGMLLIAVFTLGWFAGNGNAKPQVQVTVLPSAAETDQSYAEAETQQKTEPQTPGLVDLNRADQAELETLPGIGPELASRIVAYRETVGAFIAKEQLMDVEGIGEKRYAELEQLIIIGGTP